MRDPDSKNWDGVVLGFVIGTQEVWVLLPSPPGRNFIGDLYNTMSTFSHSHILSIPSFLPRQGVTVGAQAGLDFPNLLLYPPLG